MILKSSQLRQVILSSESVSEIITILHSYMLEAQNRLSSEEENSMIE
jgi:hypothetical protein